MAWIRGNVAVPVCVALMAAVGCVALADEAETRTGVGRRGSFLSTSGSFELSSGGGDNYNIAGNEELGDDSGVAMLDSAADIGGALDPGCKADGSHWCGHKDAKSWCMDDSW